MKNIDLDPEDTLRPEYKRSDLGEMVRGKYATTQVDFYQLTEAFLACMGDDEEVRFLHHSIGNYLAQHQPGDWTYEIDSGNQITLRYWLSEFGSIDEAITNPPVVMTAKDRKDLENALREGVNSLKTKVADSRTGNKD